jgi:hypothetical protein
MIIPRRVWFGSTDWHPEPQWFLKAMDTEKGEMRNFALKDFGGPVASAGAAQEAVLDFPDYDAGLLNDWGGGNVAWWQDYIRAEIGRANDHWRALAADPPEEIGILQARIEDQDRTIADLTRQLQGQPRRQSDVVAGAAPVTVQEAAQDIEAIENSGRRWHCEDHRVVSVRWEPYKPDGHRQMKAKGRWQEQVGAGDYWRWQNCERPVNLSALAQKGDSHE